MVASERKNYEYILFFPYNFLKFFNFFTYIHNNFVRKVNDIFKEKEPPKIDIYSLIYLESYIIPGLNFKNKRASHEDTEFLSEFSSKNLPVI